MHQFITYIDVIIKIINLFKQQYVNLFITFILTFVSNSYSLFVTLDILFLSIGCIVAVLLSVDDGVWSIEIAGMCVGIGGSRIMILFGIVRFGIERVVVEVG